MSQDFIIEVGTEELPPKAMPRLAQDFLNGIEKGLVDAEIFPGKGNIVWYAAPRRLAVMVSNLTEQQPEQTIERIGPNVKAAYSADGNPTKALEGFARSCGVDVDQLSTTTVGKDEKIFFSTTKPGEKTIDLLPQIIVEAVKKIHIPKPMRWGNSEVEFIRPVHWCLAMLGKDVVNVNVLGKQADRVSYGHRFHAPAAITLSQASDYLSALEKSKVIADFSKRENLIAEKLEKVASTVNGKVNYSDDLLKEVTAIVEWPEVLLAKFDNDFLQVPQEALISAMQGHQKSFPVFAADSSLLPYFIFVANIASKKPEQVIAGNEKVMHARLSDAAFFYHTDLKQPLENNLESLKTVTFQDKLGSLYDRTQRIKQLASAIASQLNANSKEVERAAELAKCDLMTGMVGEFPELQGIMGRYYVSQNGEAPAVCAAIEAHYKPVGADDAVPTDPVAVSVALADKLDLLTGIFGIDKEPTGDKDPFALRRAAIGVVRILLSLSTDLNVADLLKTAYEIYDNGVNDKRAAIQTYLLERLKYLMLDQGYTVQQFNAVNEVKFSSLLDFHKRLAAVKNFSQLPVANALAEANKRVKNILTKQNALNKIGDIDQSLLSEAAEKALYQSIAEQQKNNTLLLDEKNYQQVLTNLASLQQPVDQFFTDVMVMADEDAIKNNRLLLLNQLRNLFLTVADVSQLS